MLLVNGVHLAGHPNFGCVSFGDSFNDFSIEANIIYGELNDFRAM
jgi:hypothetical protein